MGRKKRDPESIPRIGVGPIDPERSLQEQIYGQLRELIVSGKLTTGTQISAQGIGEELGISRTPVKSAMDLLAQEGLLHLIGVTGAVVPGITLDELYELLTLRLVIESQVVVELGCSKNQKILGILNDSLDQMTNIKLEAESDPMAKRRFHSIDIDFHRTMAELAGMPTAAKAILHAMQRFNLQEYFPIGHTNAVIGEHSRIVKAIAKFDVSSRKKIEESFGRADMVVRQHMVATATRWRVNILDRVKTHWRDDSKQTATESL